MRTAWCLVLLVALVLCPALGTAQGAPNPHLRLGRYTCTDCHTTSGWTTVRFDHASTRFRLVAQHATAACTSCHTLRDFTGAPTECRSCHLDPHRGDAGSDCTQCHNETGWHLVRPQDAHARSRLPDLGVHTALRCEDCHRQTGVQPFRGPVTPCVTCHRTNYDNTTNPSHTALAFPARCETCHQLSTWNRALYAQHDAVFGIYRGRHAGVWSTCATCHPVSGNYQIFTCTTCHTDGGTTPQHSGVPGYQWESTSCLGCHAGGGGGSDLSFHDAIFPVFSGPHAGQWTACGACHTNPADRRVISCNTAGCHVQAATDAGHQGIPAYVYDTQQCRTCHPDGRAATFAGHDAIFPVYAGTHAGKWSACGDCHTDPASRQVFSCTSGSCHAQAVTTASHRGITGYGYVSAQCLSCHPDGRAGTFAQHDVVFPVYTGPHASQWTACTQCHTTPGDRTVVSCLTAGCHVQATTTTFHQGMTGYGYTTSQCRTCHPDGRRGTYTAHDPIFPVYSGVHAGRWAACATCHTVAGNRQQFTCMASGCHAQPTTDANHTGITGYAYQAAQCFSCHPNGQTGIFLQHDAVFPVYTGPHASQWTACSQCHTTPGNRTVVSCLTAGCHVQAATTTFHQGMTGYGYATAQCRTCHPDGRRGTYTQHDPVFPIFAGAHAGRWTDCATCHTVPGNRQQFTCMGSGCHAQPTTDVSHAAIAGYAYQAAQCFTCHPNGQAPSFAQHDAVFPVYTGPHASQWTACSQCHTAPGDRRVVSCLTAGCHVQAGTDAFHQLMTGYGYTTAQCRSCHPDGRRGTYTAHDPTFPVYSGAHAGRWATCATCHTVAGNRQQYTCMGGACHAQTTTDANHTRIPGYAYQAAQCFSCHPTGQAGTFPQHDVVFPVYSGPHASQWTACSQCHTTPGNRAVVSCLTAGCHVQAATTTFHQRIPGYSYTTAQCRSCHPDGRAGTFPQHDVIFPIFTGKHAGRWSTCETCHTVPHVRTQFTCLASGCHAASSTNNDHQGVSGYQYVSTACLTCHPRGVQGAGGVAPPIRRPAPPLIRRPV